MSEGKAKITLKGAEIEVPISIEGGSNGGGIAEWGEQNTYAKGQVVYTDEKDEYDNPFVRLWVSKEDGNKGNDPHPDEFGNESYFWGKILIGKDEGVSVGEYNEESGIALFGRGTKEDPITANLTKIVRNYYPITLAVEKMDGDYAVLANPWLSAENLKNNFFELTIQIIDANGVILADMAEKAARFKLPIGQEIYQIRTGLPNYTDATFGLMSKRVLTMPNMLIGVEVSDLLIDPKRDAQGSFKGTPL